MVFALQLLSCGYWLLAIGYWLLAIGYWLLAIGYWLCLLVVAIVGQVHTQYLAEFLLVHVNDFDGLEEQITLNVRELGEKLGDLDEF